MALITSAQTGNFNDTATWTGGVVPTVGDEARASTGHTITITANATCDEVSNAGTGIFTLNDGVTLTANVTNKSTTTNRNCLQFTAGTPAIGYIVGNLTGGTVSGAVAAANTSNGTLDITGNCLGGSAGFTYAASNGFTGTIIVTGNATGGGADQAVGLRNGSTGTCTLTGDVTGGTGANSYGADNVGAGTYNITGNVTGGSNTAFGARNNSTGTMTITGSAIASATQSGAVNISTGALSVIRAVGNGYGIGAAGGTGKFWGLRSDNISSDSRAQELEYGPNGQAPTDGAVRIVAGTNNEVEVALTTSAMKTLKDPSDGTGMPDEDDVRSGLSYALGNKTGTCAVPAASSVAFGVPVDNTTGTAALTPAAVWDALTSGMTTAGSIGARLKNAATIDTTGQALADALSPTP